MIKNEGNAIADVETAENESKMHIDTDCHTLTAKVTEGKE